MRHKHDIPDTEGVTASWTLQHDHSIADSGKARMHTHTMVTGFPYVDTTRSLTPEDADSA